MVVRNRREISESYMMDKMFGLDVFLGNWISLA